MVASSSSVEMPKKKRFPVDIVAEDNCQLLSLKCKEGVLLVLLTQFPLHGEQVSEFTDLVTY
jgi:hypothetical protein